MWLSKNAAKQPVGGVQDAGCQDGVVTIAGDSPAVLSGCEQRGLDICAPGGYIWRPESGQEVVIIKTSEGSGAVAGVKGGDSGEVSPGEVRLFSKGCSIYLKNNGEIEISGDVYINGRKI